MGRFERRHLLTPVPAETPPELSAPSPVVRQAGGNDRALGALPAGSGEEDGETAELEGPPPGFDLSAELAAATAPTDAPIPPPGGDGRDLAPPPDLGQGTGEDLAPADVPVRLPAAPTGPTGGGPAGPPTQAPLSAPPTPPTPTAQLGAPDLCSADVGAAWQGYLSAATGERQRVLDRGAAMREAIGQAAATALSDAGAAIGGLREHIAGKVSGATEQLQTTFEAARGQADTLLEGRRAELRQANQDALQAVLDRSAENRQAVQDRVTALAADARELGNLKAEALLAHADAQAQAITQHAAGVAGRYAGHDRANDIRITVQRLAQESAGRLRAEAQTGAAELRRVGEALAVKIEQDGAALVQNIVSGDAGLREEFAALLSEGEEALRRAREETQGQLDTAQSDLIGQVQQVGEAMLRAVGEVEAEQRAGIEAARDEALAAADQAVQRAVEGLDDQIRQVETWVSGLGPGENLEAVQTLCDLTQNVSVQGGAVDGELARIQGEAVARFADSGGGIGGSVEAARRTVDEQIGQVTAQAGASIQGVLQALDEGLAAQVRQFTEAWGAERDEKIANLDEARDEAFDKLEQTHAQGVEGIGQQYQDAAAALTNAKNDACGRIDREADRIANQSWWERLGSAIGSFFAGLWDALVDFLKVLGIVLLVVLAVVLVIAAVILIVKGAAVLLAVAAAVAAFLAAAAKVIAVIALILTVIGVVFALVEAAAAWMNPDLTSDEKWRATGKGVGSILLEFVPDWGVGKLIRRGRTGVQVARHADELADLGRGADNLRDGARVADDLAPGRVPGANLADDVVPPGAVANQGDEVADALRRARETGYQGDPEVFRRQFERGLRFDPETRRWTRPNEPVAGANAETAAAFEQARAQGYGGRWETFQANYDKGLRFDTASRRWRRPAGTPDSSPAPATSPAPVNGPAPATSPAPVNGPAPATGPAVGPDGLTEGQRRAETSYTLIKGVFASGTSATNGARDRYRDVQRMRGGAR